MPETVATLALQLHVDHAAISTDTYEDGARLCRIQHLGPGSTPPGHDRGPREVPAIAETSRYHGNTRAHGVDEWQARRRQAAMVRHDDDISAQISLACE